MRLHPARRLWHSLETLYQPALSVEDTRAAGKVLGLRGFWMTMLAFRAAPLGAVEAGAATAIFGGFAPDMVGRAIPAAWELASPAVCIDRRNALAGDLLRRAGVNDELAEPLVRQMAELPSELETTGHPLGAANAALPLPDDPVAALWQVATTVREHRGDGHWASWVGVGITGLQSHHILVGGSGQHETMRELRGWTPDEWSRAAEELVARGLLEANSGVLTAAGQSLRDRVEEQTDELSWSGGLSVLGEDGVDDICTALAPLVRSVRDSGLAPLLTLLAGNEV